MERVKEMQRKSKLKKMKGKKKANSVERSRAIDKRQSERHCYYKFLMTLFGRKLWRIYYYTLYKYATIFSKGAECRRRKDASE